MFARPGSFQVRLLVGQAALELLVPTDHEQRFVAADPTVRPACWLVSMRLAADL
ncbi:hypothetical protein BN8_04626 [Fibrisoma limi BUZ 3]|uniref:Uncharacterized protein n=1 Tax=Fibrisoma limi BUZ 3 TaxID=1185876 RepID=I2GN94_9BACT|nr:hypothetical protein BN8_04626 [Fibrisoma limi BUZ 3]